MNNERNIFEIATRGTYRFAFKGLLSTEDLWHLTVKELDTIFKSLNSQLKQEKEESLLDTKTQQNEELETKIQIIKHIVNVKQAEEEARLNAKAKKEEKQKLLGLLASKKDEELKGKSAEEIKKMIDDLDD